MPEIITRALQNGSYWLSPKYIRPTSPLFSVAYGASVRESLVSFTNLWACGISPKFTPK